MLKDNYTFEYNTNTIFWLETSLRASLEANANTTHSVCALTFLSLKPFINRLAVRSLSDKPVKKASIKRVEAVAFHIAYKAGYIDTKNYLIKEIFTAIDRTV